VAEPVGRISQTLVDDIVRELGAVNETHHLWLRTRTEVDHDDGRLRVVVTMPDDDPFEPTRLARIFDTIESVIVSHMPHDLPIREDHWAWLVVVQVPSGDSIDSIHGGEKIAGRTSRYSDHVGPPTRP
jgi:hypothetical protein